MQCRPVIFWENGFCQYFADTNDMNLEPNEGQEKKTVWPDLCVKAKTDALGNSLQKVKR